MKFLDHYFIPILAISLCGILYLIFLISPGYLARNSTLPHIRTHYLLTLGLVGVTVFYLIRHLMTRMNEQWKGYSLGNQAGAVGMTVLTAFSFTVLNARIWIYAGDSAFHVPLGLDSSQSAQVVNAFLLHLCDLILSAALLDTLETYRIGLSGVSHADNFWICTHVFFMRTILTVVLLGVVLEYIYSPLVKQVKSKLPGFEANGKG